MVEKILNNTTPYGKNRASHEGSLHSSTLIHPMKYPSMKSRPARHHITSFIHTYFYMDIQ